MGYGDLLDSVDLVPVFNKDEPAAAFNVAYLIRFELFHTGF